LASQPYDQSVVIWPQFKMTVRLNPENLKTANGARIGDMFMSLIQSCRYNEVNPFDYFMALATHPEKVRADPAAWLPWNYPEAGSG
jgi:hypothetical protein